MMRSQRRRLRTCALSRGGALLGSGNDAPCTTFAAAWPHQGPAHRHGASDALRAACSRRAPTAGARGPRPPCGAVAACGIRLTMCSGRLGWSLILALCLVDGCGKSGGSGGADKVLRLSMIPTTDPGKMARESAPLVSYLEQALGAKVELTVPLNYAAVVEAFGADKVDIAYFGGFTYVQARKRFAAQPLVQRDRDQAFHSLFITQADAAIGSLADLAGKRFAFGDVNSTSEHLMPEYYLRESHVDPGVIA